MLADLTPSIADLLAQVESLKLEIAKRDELIAFLSHDKAFDILTRPAIELRLQSLTLADAYLIYCDLDHLHDLNEIHDKEGANLLISRSLLNVRDSDLVAAGRWLFGDELLFVIPSNSDPHAFCERLLSGLNENGLSATLVYLRYDSNYLQSIERADVVLSAVKRSGGRGSIISLLEE